MQYDVIPAAIFTLPEIGSVGLREHLAADRGIAVRTGNFQYRTFGREPMPWERSRAFSRSSPTPSPTVSWVCALSAPMPRTSFTRVALAIKAGLTVRQVADLVHAHPTLSEGFMECGRS
ncbi:MAG: hypothetical protein MZV70_00970 [Desulfobacterales bacterium]|nr:hypothetical protein [Desulfobacterales bacterium]